MNKKVIEFLNEHKIKYRWLDHPAVFTVADLKNLPEDMNPIKNLLIKEESSGRKFLIVMAGEVRLDLKALREKLNLKRLNFVNDETLMQTFGVKPGAVSIFGFLNNKSADVEVVIDEQILKSDNELGFHPNDNTATVFFVPNDLEKVLKDMGCKYTIMKLC
jgi:Ala-tRNA(Pro) deacylase